MFIEPQQRSMLTFIKCYIINIQFASVDRFITWWCICGITLNLNKHAVIAVSRKQLHPTCNRVTNEIYICEAVCDAVRKKNHGNKRARLSRDSSLTFKQHFFDVPTKSELTRASADCHTGIKQLEEFLKKSHWTVTRQWLRSRDRRPTVK